MSVDRWTDKADVVHIHNGILLSHEKEWIWISWTQVDEPRTCYTEWSKSKREKQILYINACIWNLERRYWWTRLQGRNRDADAENGLATCGEEAGGRNWDSSVDMHTLLLFSCWVVSDTFETPTDCSLPGSSLQRISQARTLEGVAS